MNSINNISKTKIIYLSDLDNNEIIDLNDIVNKMVKTVSFEQFKDKVGHREAIKWLNEWIIYYKEKIVKKRFPDMKFKHSSFLENEMYWLDIASDCDSGDLYILDTMLLSQEESIDMFRWDFYLGDNSIPIDVLLDYIPSYMLEESFPIIIERDDDTIVYKQWRRENFINDLKEYCRYLHEYVISDYDIKNNVHDISKIYTSIEIILKVLRIDYKEIDYLFKQNLPYFVDKLNETFDFGFSKINK